MAETRFPNGLDVDSAHTGNVPSYVTADGARWAAGTTIVTAGSVQASTGLSTVTFVTASPYGVLLSTAGTVGGFVGVTAQGASGAGSIILRAYDQMGTASVAAGTAAWFAVGT